MRSSSILLCSLITLPGMALAAPGTLTARVDGDAVVMVRDGRPVRLVQPNLADAQLTVVPMRSDGSEPMLWIAAQGPGPGGIGLLVRYANPPQIVYTHSYGTSRRGVGSTRRSPWLLDVDGDGFHDLVEHVTSHSDVGTQLEGVYVRRYDPAVGGFAPDDRALSRRAPRSPYGTDPRLRARVAAALKVSAVDGYGAVGGLSEPQTPPRLGTIGGGGGGPPSVGADSVELVGARKAGEKRPSRFHLAHLRFGREVEVVSTVDLGPAGFPPGRCEGGRSVGLKREGASVVAVWPVSDRALVEQRVPWDGKALGQPTAAPVQIASCDAR